MLRLFRLWPRFAPAALVFCLCALPSVARARGHGAPAAREDQSQFVSFEDDPLDANLSTPFGDPLFTGHLPPARTLLIRPRTNFVPELYKSVENL